MRTLWMYLFQAPGTILIWLFRGGREKLSDTYRAHMSYSGLIGMALAAGVVFFFL